MDEKTYIITLEDGTILTNLYLNGNNFVSKREVYQEIFDGNLGHVIIDDGESKETHDNMELIQITKMNEEWWFVLRDISPSEMEKEKLRADIDFLAMMANIDL